jgi:ubiquinone biosynthesis O-methyltransferase
LRLQCEIYIPGSRITYETYRIHLTRYIFASKYVKGARVLDIACGSGFGSSYLIRKGAESVTGVDLSEEAINIAKNNFQKRGLTFQVGTAEDLPFADNSFDIITSMGTIDHMNDPALFLRHAQRVLQPGGYFISSLLNREVITPFPLHEIVDPSHIIEYSPMELNNLVNKYFINVQTYGENYGKRRLMQLRRLVYYIVYRKIHMPYAVPVLMQRSLAKLDHKDLSFITYSEDAIDAGLLSDNEWTLITSSKMASTFINYIVTGQKAIK